ncbi:MAG: hypothetical protein CMI30_08470 [Opitutae bacterium]|nr:hypothetical protein [Opitutae bacterium]
MALDEEPSQGPLEGDQAAPPSTEQRWLIEDGQLVLEDESELERKASEAQEISDWKQSTLIDAMAEAVDYDSLEQISSEPFHVLYGNFQGSGGTYTGWVLKRDNGVTEVFWLLDGKRDGIGGVIHFDEAENGPTQVSPKNWRSGFQMFTISMDFNFEDVYSILSEAVDIAQLDFSKIGSNVQVVDAGGDPFNGWIKHASPENGWKALGQYKNGLRAGPWVTWDEGGRLLLEGSFKDGKKNGLWTEWSYDGEFTAFTSCGHYVDGLKEGFWHERSPDETESGRYVKGRREGEWSWSTPHYVFEHPDEYHEGPDYYEEPPDDHYDDPPDDYYDDPPDDYYDDNYY